MEDPGVIGRIIFKGIFKKWGGKAWTGLIWLRIDRWRTLVDAVIHLKESSSSIKCGEYLDKLRNC